jgi:hypothetical protein
MSDRTALHEDDRMVAILSGDRRPSTSVIEAILVPTKFHGRPRVASGVCFEAVRWRLTPMR